MSLCLQKTVLKTGNPDVSKFRDFRHWCLSLDAYAPQKSSSKNDQPPPRSPFPSVQVRPSEALELDHACLVAAETKRNCPIGERGPLNTQGLATSGQGGSKVNMINLYRLESETPIHSGLLLTLNTKESGPRTQFRRSLAWSQPGLSCTLWLRFMSLK